jgi:O-antigen ligase
MIVFAGTLPKAAPHPPPALAWGLAAVVAASLAASIAGLVAGRARRFPKSLFIPLAAVVAAQLAALAWAVHPAGAVFSVLATLAAYVVLLAATEVLPERGTRRAFLACYLISAAAASAFACVLSLAKLPPAMFAYEHGRASGTFLQPNEFAGYLLFVIPIALAQAAAPRWLRALGRVTAAVCLAGLVLSVSRAAIIGLALALLIFMRQFGRWAVTGYAAIAATGLVALATVFRNVAHDPSENAARLAVWGGALRMAQRFALTGVGPFGFHLVYPNFRLPQYSVDEVHAHSLVLQLLVEYGVLGLAAIAWLTAAAVTQCVRVRRGLAHGDRESTLLFAAVVTGFAASALQNSIDVVTTFLLVVAWPMLGLLLSMGSQPRRAV